MNKIQNEQFQEVRYEETLDNGLHVILWQKEDYQKSLFMMATPLSALDLTQISEDGTEYHFPAGIAHFLEHKMFEMKDGDVMEEFSKLGANVNAFTSYTETAYYFSTTEDIEKPLNLLLDFVQSLEITKDSVEKEKGIIVQELHMYKQMSDSRLLMELYASIFKEHPLRFDIGGTDDSVLNTTLEELYACYNINYHPNSMVLVGVTSEDPKRVMNIIKENQANKQFKKPIEVTRKSILEPQEVNREEYSFTMDVSIPKVAIAYKLNGIRDIIERIKMEWSLRLLLDAYFTNLNPEFQSWLDQGIFNDFVGCDIDYGEDYGILMFYAETEKKEQFYQIVEETMTKLKQGIMDDAMLERLKKRYIGQTIRYLNSFDDIAISTVRSYFEHSDFFDGIVELQKITKDDLKLSVLPLKHASSCKVMIEPENTL